MFYRPASFIVTCLVDVQAMGALLGKPSTETTAMLLHPNLDDIVRRDKFYESVRQSMSPPVTYSVRSVDFIFKTLN